MPLPALYQKTILSLLLVVITFVLYWPILDAEFVWDAAILHEDPSLQSMENLFSGFSGQALQETRENGELVRTLKYYRPFTKALHVIEYQFFGVEPFGYKLTNIALHAAVALLLFALVMAIQGSVPIAFFGALLFLVKPIHTEAVAWTYSDSYLLTAMFALACLLAFKRKRHLLALTAFALTLLSHEMGVLLLPIVGLYAVLIENRTNRQELMLLLPYVLLTLAFLVLRRLSVGPIPLSGVEPLTFANTAAFVFAKYLKIFFLPDAAVTIYRQTLFATPNAYVVAGYLLVLLSAWAAWLLWRRDRILLFWFLWFFVWSAVSYNIGSLGEYMMAEKLIYIASIGPGVLGVALLLRLFTKHPRPIYAVLCAIALVSAVNTSLRLPYWENTNTYVKKALEHTPDFPIGWFALGNDYLERGDNDNALKAFEQVIVYDKNFSLALNNIGNLHFIQGRTAQAAEFWQQAVRCDPTNPQPYFNIGMAMEKLARYKEAVEYYVQYLTHAKQPDPRARQRISELKRTLGPSAKL